jgi:uncharacterized protein YqeY
MLIEQIRKERMIAYKEKNNIKKDVLGCLISESCKEAKEPDDKKVLAVIKKFIEGAEEIKRVTDSKEYEFYKANMEITILDSYRPVQLTEHEIKVEITNLFVSTSEAKLGDVMSYFKTNYADRYDGGLVSRLVKEYLANGQ